MLRVSLRTAATVAAAECCCCHWLRLLLLLRLLLMAADLLAFVPGLPCYGLQTGCIFSLHMQLQLHQWQLWLNLEKRSEAWPCLPQPLAARCFEAFCSEEGTPSRLQRAVVRELGALKLEPREEVRTPQGYSLDAVVSIDGHEVAVEVDGPSHFVGRVPNSATMLKRRQLLAARWPLLSVPYWEWDELTDASMRRNYLEQGLQGVLAAFRQHSS